jgi:hypothetical protein
VALFSEPITRFIDLFSDERERPVVHADTGTHSDDIMIITVNVVTHFIRKTPKNPGYGTVIVQSLFTAPQYPAAGCNVAACS